MARIEPAINRGALLQLYSAMWGPIYEAVLNILGSTGTILPIADPKHGQPNASTCATVGDEQVTLTWSEAPSSFDTPVDLTDPASFQGIAPIVEFNGSDEEADTPDAAFWTPSPDTITAGAWVYKTAGSGGQILAKWDNNVGSEDREWLLSVDSDLKPGLQVYDEANNAQIGRKGPAITAATWTHIVGTYDGGTASSGITVYVNGVAVGDADNNSGASYTNIVGGATIVTLAHFFGSGGSPGSFYAGKIAGGPLGPFWVPSELTADQVLRLYELGRRTLGL